MAGLQKMHKI